MATNSFSQTIFPWLKANLGKGCLGILTGTDTKALRAAVEIIGLWAYDESDEALQAFGIVVRRMQPSAYFLAYHAIAHCADWSHRSQVWAKAGLPALTNPGRCAFE